MKIKKTVKSAGRPSKGGRMVAMRLSPEAQSQRDALAMLWNCDKTAVVERALALAHLNAAD